MKARLVADINPAGFATAPQQQCCDPSGDYTQQAFFADGQGGRSDPKTRGSAGWRQTAFLPAGEWAGGGMADQSRLSTDIFIGYASYAPVLRQVNSLRVVDIPEPYNPVAGHMALPAC